MKTKTKIVIAVSVSVLVLLALLAGMEAYQMAKTSTPAWAQGKPTTTIRGGDQRPGDPNKGRQVQRRKGSVGTNNGPINITTPSQFNTPFGQVEAPSFVFREPQAMYELRAGTQGAARAGNAVVSNSSDYVKNLARNTQFSAGITIPDQVAVGPFKFKPAFAGQYDMLTNPFYEPQTPEEAAAIRNIKTMGGGIPSFTQPADQNQATRNFVGVTDPLTDQGSSSGYQGGYGGRRGFGTRYGWGNGGGGYSDYSGYPSWYQNLVNWNIK